MQSCYSSFTTQIPLNDRAYATARPILIRMIKAAALVLAIGITGCDGGAIVFEAGTAARVDVAENTEGVVWQAKASVTGTSNSAKLIYELKGSDAAAFSINPANGAVSFKTPADFEQPVDADKNNEYLFSIEVKADAKSAVQQVSLRVNNVTQPVAELISPKPYENVGAGATIEVETVVKFYDAESNSAIKQGQVKINQTPLAQSDADSQLWLGRLSVPDGGVQIQVSGSQGEIKSVELTARLLNKANGFKAAGFGVFTSDSIALIGLGYFGLQKLDLNNFTIEESWSSIAFRDAKAAVKFQSLQPNLYAVINSGEWGSIWRIAFRGPDSIYFYSLDFSFNDSRIWLDLAVDEPRNRLILLQALSEGEDRYRFFTAGLGEAGQILSQTVQPLFDLPKDFIQGDFKYFNLHAKSDTYLVASEHSVDGSVRTQIQGFGQDASIRFRSEVGADTSNLVIDEEAGFIYVAENSHASTAKIKVIEIATGKVSDLLEEKSEIAHGAYTSLGLDKANNLLYVGDTVSDAIYVVNLMGKSVRELNYIFIPYKDEEAVEN